MRKSLVASLWFHWRLCKHAWPLLAFFCAQLECRRCASWCVKYWVSWKQYISTYPFPYVLSWLSCILSAARWVLEWPDTVMICSLSFILIHSHLVFIAYFIQLYVYSMRRWVGLQQAWNTVPAASFKLRFFLFACSCTQYLCQVGSCGVMQLPSRICSELPFLKVNPMAGSLFDYYFIVAAIQETVTSWVSICHRVWTNEIYPL